MVKLLFRTQTEYPVKCLPRVFPRSVSYFRSAFLQITTSRGEVLLRASDGKTLCCVNVTIPVLVFLFSWF